MSDSNVQFRHAEAFRALHARAGAFIIPNPWDAGSARLLAMAGFDALATTSAGFAYSRGRPDNAIGRDEMLGHIAEIVAAGGLPVSADLENGFGDDPATCAQTIRFGADAGLVGGSIEDATGRDDVPIYPFDLAVERVRAAVAAARSLPFPFTLVARCENFLHGRPDLDDTLRRLTAFAEAGADCLFAPGLRTREQIRAVVDAVAPKPVNVIMGLTGAQFSLRELEELGVRRVSVGSSLARAAYGAFLRAAKEIAERGTFTYADDAVPFATINGMFKR